MHDSERPSLRRRYRPSSEPTALVLYHYNQYPRRDAVTKHLYSFRDYSPGSTFLWNAARGSCPSWVRAIPFDLVIFHTSFLSTRWDRELFDETAASVGWIIDRNVTKAILPQDEFLNIDLVRRFIDELRVQHVFTPAPASEWSRLYPSVDEKSVRIWPILTGYLDDAAVRRWGMSRPTSRPIDIGYRAWESAFWLGRLGLIKRAIAEVFASKAPEFGLRTDIVLGEAGTFYGRNWYAFLQTCKYTIGVEGGASILDADGTIRACTEAYLRTKPSASFDEVERACFPAMDGSLNLRALSPRHLEACLTRTCQVLVEGEYSGVLKPNLHYITLKPDFSDLDEVLAQLKADDLRHEITERAYHDIVASGRYSYREFVRYVFESALDTTSAVDKGVSTAVLALRSKSEDDLYWAERAFRHRRERWTERVRAHLPDWLRTWVRRLRSLARRRTNKAIS